MAKIQKITMFAEPCEVANQMEADFEENSNNLKIMNKIVEKKFEKNSCNNFRVFRPCFLAPATSIPWMKISIFQHQKIL